MKLQKFGSQWFTLASLTLLFAGISGTVHSQDSKPALSIGDQAPPLAYSAWIKGNPIASLSGPKLYILEFWATWCTPCIAAMPHLSEIAEKHKGKLEIIAVDASERTGKASYSSATTMVKAFVEKNTEKMKFNVILDNDQRAMSKNWLEQAKISGIPATIIVKDNVIQWIGHPMHLEPILDELLAGKYKLSERKASYEKGISDESAERTIYRKNIAKIDSISATGAYKAAVAFADEAAKLVPGRASSYGLKKLQLLMAHFPEEETITFLKTCEKEKEGWASSYALYIGGQENLPLKFYEEAAAIFSRYTPTNILFLEAEANLYNKLGQYKEAMVTQQRAIDMLIENQKSKPQNDSEVTIQSFKKKFEQYKQRAAKG